MSASASKLWLVAYDVGCPTRLRRVHRTVRRRAVRVQYSLYAARERGAGIESLLDELGALIDDAEDDVRAYHIPASCTVWTIGRAAMPDGVVLDAGQVVRMLGQADPDAEHDDDDAGDGIELVP